MIQVDEKVLREVGDNLLAGIVDGKLVIVIDPEQSFGLSSTGKTTTIASSGGFTRLPDGLTGNIYIGRKKEQ
jgi:hypothetical protein